MKFSFCSVVGTDSRSLLFVPGDPGTKRRRHPHLKRARKKKRKVSQGESSAFAGEMPAGNALDHGRGMTAEADSACHFPDCRCGRDRDAERISISGFAVAICRDPCGNAEDLTGRQQRCRNRGNSFVPVTADRKRAGDPDDEISSSHIPANGKAFSPVPKDAAIKIAVQISCHSYTLRSFQFSFLPLHYTRQRGNVKCFSQIFQFFFNTASLHAQNRLHFFP